MFTDDEYIRELNRSYRNIDTPTNVLSFSMLEGEFTEKGGNLLGDLVISAQTAHREAQKAGISLNERLSQLLVHGILHLVGYDHEPGGEYEKEMIKKSCELLCLIEPDSTLDYF